ncbi:cobalamin B12-binding domain-containing protein [Aestuariivirga sp.]|uniref:cobalamin B12-binding domain-containing protein n=1 Tax=Aestuariivirga sp. TaxID=2650926 RepID=UPI003BAA02C3
MNDASPFRLPAVTESLVDAFTSHILNGQEADAAALMDELLAGGLSAETVMMDLLAPSARLMGEHWCEDRRDFVEVTAGLARLQQHVRQFRLPPVSGAGLKGQALLFPVPGEQHSFGVRLVEEHLLRAGWKVNATLRSREDDIRNLVSADYYDFVGISLTSDRLLPALRSAIRCVRTYSRNREVRIAVGGVLFTGHTAATLGLDVDAVVHDAREAVVQAENWYGLAEVE